MTNTCRFTFACITVLFICSACGTPSCGTPSIQPQMQRIVGGRPSTQGSLPWMALLTELDQPSCGGSIIADNLILTAAHCFEDTESKIPSRWKVYVGKYHAHKTDTSESVHHVQQIISHEAYDTASIANDIAILVLSNRITFSSATQTICLPSNQVVSVGQKCLAAGWGETMNTGSPGILNQVTLPILDSRKCMRFDWYSSDFIPSLTFCAGYDQGGRDSCADTYSFMKTSLFSSLKGDSGGPLICRYDGGKWYQMGITSWGYECARPKWPGIYTNVTRYIPWIQKKALDLGIRLN